jgi:hypothetical protein
MISAVSASFGSGGGSVKLLNGEGKEKLLNGEGKEKLLNGEGKEKLLNGEGKEKFPIGDAIGIVSIGGCNSLPSTRIAETAITKKEPYTRVVPLVILDDQ